MIRSQGAFLIAFAFVLAVLALDALAQTPQMAPLLGPGDITVVGSFRVPAGAADYDSTTPARLALTSSAALLIGETEITIPETIGTGTTLDSLPTATVTGRKVSLGSRVNECNPSSPNGKFMPGAWPLGGDEWIASCVDGYDGGRTQNVTHFRISNGTITGPIKVGSARAAFVAGWIGAIPTEWQALLGGDVMGGGCCYSIISRTSHGPAATVFTASQVTGTGRIAGTEVLGYPMDHATLGGCDQLDVVGTPSKTFNCTALVGGFAFPTATRSVLFFGHIGLGYTSLGQVCYGNGYDDPSVTGSFEPDGITMKCYDPVPSGKGAHAYPYAYHVWAYDANDLLAVKNGKKKPWDPLPASWTFTLPFNSPEQYNQIEGVAYDPVKQLIYLSVYKAGGAVPADSASPVVTVLKVNAAGGAPPSTPAPTP